MSSDIDDKTIVDVESNQKQDVERGKSEGNAIHGAGAAQLTGWAAMDKTIRGIDEEKVQDTNADMDALLVFAGLFSAVVTAFVLYSFQNLQEDPSDTMVGLLRQISTQLNTSDPTSRTSHSLLTTFSPPAPVVIVNVLWLASLMISLIAASFAITVKQWLRMYLLVDPAYISPRARLRIRHLRYPGLEDWRVFSVAASLPFLLQFAVSLFFLGMCVFTTAVHASVGGTSIAVVVGWACLFTVVSLAPLLSSRCPYQTPLLNDKMPLWRQKLFRIKYLRHFYVGPVDDPYAPRALTNPLEESVVARDEARDLEIISSVDTVLLNDNFLAATMWEPLQQADGTPTAFVEFACSLLQHRIPVLWQGENIILSSHHSVTEQCWASVVDAVTRAFEADGQILLNVMVTWPKWVEIGITILFSHSAYRMTPRGERVCSVMLSPHLFGKTSLVLRRIVENGETNIWPRLQLALVGHPMLHMMQVIQATLEQRYGMPYYKLVQDGSLFEYCPPDQEHHSLFRMLISVVDCHLADFESFDEWPALTEGIMNLVLGQIRSDIVPPTSVFAWFCHPRSLIPFEEMNASVTVRFLAYFAAKPHICLNFFDGTNHEGQDALIRNMTSMFKKYNSNSLDDSLAKAKVELDFSSTVQSTRQMLRDESSSQVSSDFPTAATALRREIAKAHKKCVRMRGETNVISIVGADSSPGLSTEESTQKVRGRKLPRMSNIVRMSRLTGSHTSSAAESEAEDLAGGLSRNGSTMTRKGSKKGGRGRQRDWSRSASTDSYQ